MESNIPVKYQPVYRFLEDHLGGGRDYCLLSNKTIGERSGNLEPATVSNHLTALKKLGAIVVAKGSPITSGFDISDKNDKRRRIYLATHEDVKHFTPLFKEGIQPPHPYETKFKDVNVGMIPRRVRHDKHISLLAKAVYTEIWCISSGGNCSAPPHYYGYALGCNDQEATNALYELFEAGHIWLFNRDSLWIYGTITGLWQAITVAAASGKKEEVERLKSILKENSVYRGVSGLKKSIKRRGIN